MGLLYRPAAFTWALLGVPGDASPAGSPGSLLQPASPVARGRGTVEPRWLFNRPLTLLKNKGPWGRKGL